MAAGSGIGAALGLPASIKTAVLIAAAAATVGTAEIAVTRADQRPPRARRSAALVAQAPAVAASATAASARLAGALGGLAVPRAEPVAVRLGLARGFAVADGGRRADARGEPARRSRHADARAVGDADADGDSDGARHDAAGDAVARPVGDRISQRQPLTFRHALTPAD